MDVHKQFAVAVQCSLLERISTSNYISQDIKSTDSIKEKDAYGVVPLSYSGFIFVTSTNLPANMIWSTISIIILTK
jgi:hypothetical protein